MTIPNVYMTWCSHKAKCRWCEKPITAGTEMVNVFFWNKGSDDKRKWNVRHYYHPQCWIDQGLDYLKMNPYVPRTRWSGTTRSKNPLTEEQRKLRYKLLRRKASIDQRLRNMKSDYPERVLVEARLNMDIANLMLEITKVGGIPRKWLGE